MKIKDIDSPGLRHHIKLAFSQYSETVENDNELAQGYTSTRLRAMLGMLGAMCDEDEFYSGAEYMLTCAQGIKYLPYEWREMKRTLDKRKKT